MLGLFGLAITVYIFNTTGYDMTVMYLIIAWIFGIYYFISSETL